MLHSSIIEEKLLNTSDLTDIIRLAFEYPDNKAAIFEFLFQPEKFQQYALKYTSIKEILRNFPEYKEKIFSLIRNAEEIKRLLLNTGNIEYGLYSIQLMIKDGLDTKDKIMSMIPDELSLQHLINCKFKGTYTVTAVYYLCQLYPDKTSDIFHCLKEPKIFFTLVENASQFCTIEDKLKNHREELLQILFSHPQSFKQLIGTEKEQLAHMAKIFPEYGEIFKSTDIDQACTKGLQLTTMRIPNASTKISILCGAYLIDKNNLFMFLPKELIGVIAGLYIKSAFQSGLATFFTSSLYRKQPQFAIEKQSEKLESKSGYSK